MSSCISICLRRADLNLKFAAEEFEREVEALLREDRIVAWTFVAQEGMSGVDFVPGVEDVRFLKPGTDLIAASEWDMRVLATEDHEQFAMHFVCTLQGIVVLVIAECGCVDVGCVKASRGADIGLHGGAEGEVAAEADAHDPKLAVAGRHRGEVVESCASVGVIRGELFFKLVEVAFVGSLLVVGQEGASYFEFVIDLGDGDDVTVPGEECGCAANGAGELEYRRSLRFELSFGAWDFSLYCAERSDFAKPTAG